MFSTLPGHLSSVHLGPQACLMACAEASARWCSFVGLNIVKLCSGLSAGALRELHRGAILLITEDRRAPAECLHASQLLAGVWTELLVPFAKQPW